LANLPVMCNHLRQPLRVAQHRMLRIITTFPRIELLGPVAMAAYESKR
jgi:hypothetical protein